MDDGVFARVWTVPNLISLLRLACAPIVWWLLFAADEAWWAAILLGVLGASDWVDGWIARRFDQGSELGKILDPTADRILLLSGVLALLVDGSVPVWYGVLLLAREIVIAVVTVGLAAAGARRIDVLWAGKAGTLAAMFSLPAFLGASISDGTFHVLCVLVAYVFAIPALVLSYYAAVRYVPEARRALREGRAAVGTPDGLDAEGLR
ncbi:MAG: CDP-alcohol phosphatidyltransferase family protein [Actinomycetota bacterium]